MIKDALINNLHTIMRSDPFILEMFTSAGITTDNLEANLQDLVNQYWIDTATWGLDKWESILGIPTNLTQSYESRRSGVRAKWRSNGKADISLLQTVADSWYNGQIDVSFASGTINVTFTGFYGVPGDIDGFKAAIEAIKPAHLAIAYAYLYTKWSKAQTVAWNILKAKTWDSLLNGGTV
jgi:hypothetical protein